MYHESSEGQVTITLSSQDYQWLVMCLGYALGTAVKENEQQMANAMIRLANTINDGNPQWRTYEETSKGAVQ